MSTQVACVQCGAPTTAQTGKPQLIRCGHCQTVLLVSATETRRTASIEAARSAEAAQGILAILCSLCGGPYPPELLNHIDTAKCHYCNHPANVAPNVRAMLTMLIKHPEVIPMALKYMVRIWLGITIGFVACIGLYAVTHSSYSGYSETASLAAKTAIATKTKGAAPQRIETNYSSKKFTIHGWAGRYPSFQIGAMKLDDAVLCVKASLVDEKKNITQSRWITLWDKLPEQQPASHPFGEWSFSQGGRISHLRPSDYTVRIDEVRYNGSGPLPDLSIRVSSMHTPPLGYFIFVANLLIWLFIADMRFMRGQFIKAPTKSWVARALAFASFVLLLLVTFSLPPFDMVPPISPSPPLSVPKMCGQ